VAEVDQLDSLGPAAVVDREQMAAGQSEQLRDPVRPQPPRDETSAVEPRRGLGLVATSRDANTALAPGRTMVRREAIQKEVSVEATQTALREHLEFDRMCSTLEEFDHLPAISVSTLERRPDEREGGDTELDQLILAGLVSPV
jgi:hypothetical protein